MNSIFLWPIFLKNKMIYHFINRQEPKFWKLVKTTIISIIANIKQYNYPYKKVTGSVSVCLSEPKDLANRQTDMVLLYSLASHRYWDDL